MPDEERERQMTLRLLMSLGNLRQDATTLGFGASMIVMAERATVHHGQAVTDTPGKRRM